MIFGSIFKAGQSSEVCWCQVFENSADCFKNIKEGNINDKWYHHFLGQDN